MASITIGPKLELSYQLAKTNKGREYLEEYLREGQQCENDGYDQAIEVPALLYMYHKHNKKRCNFDFLIAPAILTLFTLSGCP